MMVISYVLENTTGSYQRLDLFIKVLWLFCPNLTDSSSKEKKIAKDRKVIPDPIDDRKFQE